MDIERFEEIILMNIELFRLCTGKHQFKNEIIIITTTHIHVNYTNKNYHTIGPRGEKWKNLTMCENLRGPDFF